MLSCRIRWHSSGKRKLHNNRNSSEQVTVVGPNLPSKMQKKEEADMWPSSQQTLQEARFPALFSPLSAAQYCQVCGYLLLFFLWGPCASINVARPLLLPYYAVSLTPIFFLLYCGATTSFGIMAVTAAIPTAGISSSAGGCHIVGGTGRMHIRNAVGPLHVQDHYPRFHLPAV